MADLVVVGSGFFGLTVAERPLESSALGAVLDRRHHIGGNAYSEKDPETGIEVHRYGAHLFHTSNERVWEYVNRFTTFTGLPAPGVHELQGQGLPDADQPRHDLPVLRHGLHARPRPARWSPSRPARSTGDRRQPRGEGDLADRPPALRGVHPRVHGASSGRPTPRSCPPEIITRLPVRYTFDNRYFNDTYEGLPVDGYTAWLERMADHPNIEVAAEHRLLRPARDEHRRGSVPVVYTGPVDRYFDYSEGDLGWRTLDFEREVLPIGDFQGTSVMNYADEDVPYTRIHEFRHFHPERDYPTDKTVIMREFSRFAERGDEPYYPINTAEDRRAPAGVPRPGRAGERDVLFGGRLGTYKYLDMHMAIGSALSMFDNRIRPHFTRAPPASAEGGLVSTAST